MPAVPIDPRDRALCRAGGIAAITLASAYVVITALYAASGPVPTGGGEAWLQYLSGKSAAWWAISGLSVLTDALFFPVGMALYVMLRSADRNLALAGSGLLALFAVLDLAVTWPNYAALVVLSGDYASAASVAQRAAAAVAAGAPAAMLGSRLFGLYAILVPSLGILAVTLAMRQASFGRAAVWVGVATGVTGIVAVAGPLISSSLGSLAILTSVLTVVWVLIAGRCLLTAGRRDAADLPGARRRDPRQSAGRRSPVR